MVTPGPPISRDTADLFRVYRPEWQIVYVAVAAPHSTDQALLAECEDVYRNRFLGRVHDIDVRFQTVGAGPLALGQLQLRLPTMKGEFVTADRAQAAITARGWLDAEIVARNSRRDHEIRAYSVKKLLIGPA